jgi:hypothetical protein
MQVGFAPPSPSQNSPGFASMQLDDTYLHLVHQFRPDSPPSCLLENKAATSQILYLILCSYLEMHGLALSLRFSVFSLALSSGQEHTVRGRALQFLLDPRRVMDIHLMEQD